MRLRQRVPEFGAATVCFTATFQKSHLYTKVISQLAHNIKEPLLNNGRISLKANLKHATQTQAAYSYVQWTCIQGRNDVTKKSSKTSVDNTKFWATEDTSRSPTKNPNWTQHNYGFCGRTGGLILTLKISLAALLTIIAKNFKLTIPKHI